MKGLIACVGRSGSTWLANALSASGVNAEHEALTEPFLKGVGEWLVPEDEHRGFVDVSCRLRIATHKLRRVYPDTPLLWLARDGRDTVRSWVARHMEFERACFKWAEESASATHCDRLVRFEDLLTDYWIFGALAHQFGGHCNMPQWKSLCEFVARPTENHLCPAWPGWSSVQRLTFDSICGPTMAKFGYYPPRMQ